MLKFLLDNFCSKLMIGCFEIFNTTKRTFINRKQKSFYFWLKLIIIFLEAIIITLLVYVSLLRYVLLLIILKYFMLKHVPQFLDYLLFVCQWNNFVLLLRKIYHLIIMHKVVIRLSYTFRLASIASIYMAIIQCFFNVISSPVERLKVVL